MLNLQGDAGSSLIQDGFQIGIASFGIDGNCHGLNAISSIRRYLRWIEKSKSLLEEKVWCPFTWVSHCFTCPQLHSKPEQCVSNAPNMPIVVVGLMAHLEFIFRMVPRLRMWQWGNIICIMKNNILIWFVKHASNFIY